jgi:hypothetical protein
MKDFPGDGIETLPFRAVPIFTHSVMKDFPGDGIERFSLCPSYGDWSGTTGMRAMFYGIT